MLFRVTANPLQGQSSHDAAVASARAAAASASSSGDAAAAPLPAATLREYRELSLCVTQGVPLALGQLQVAFQHHLMLHKARRRPRRRKGGQCIRPLPGRLCLVPDGAIALGCDGMVADRSAT